MSIDQVESVFAEKTLWEYFRMVLRRWKLVVLVFLLDPFAIAGSLLLLNALFLPSLVHRRSRAALAGRGLLVCAGAAITSPSRPRR